MCIRDRSSNVSLRLILKRNNSPDGRIDLDLTARFASTPAITAGRPARACEQLDVRFSEEHSISERVIFPITPFQSYGIEEPSFIEFEDRGNRTYYATHTYHTGNGIRSELLPIKDFMSFCMSLLAGTRRPTEVGPGQVGTQGRRPGRVSPVRVIAQWLQDRRLRPDCDLVPNQSLAFR